MALSITQRATLLAATQDRLWYKQYTGGFGSQYVRGDSPWSGDTVSRPTIAVLVREGLIVDVKDSQRMGGGFQALIPPTEKGRLEARA